ncbi:MAG: asparagine synthase-related protein, partial [Candidatus Gracilibacteria bacterium]
DVHFAARDPMGVKPLYKSRDAGLTYYASEMKALSGTASDIEEILPSHYEFGEKTGQYFEFKHHDLQMTDTEMIERFKDLFDKAVAKRVQTDLPVAMIFSGGLDSAAVLAYALRHHSNITAITMGFEGSADLEAAKRFCKERGIKQVIRLLDIEKLKTDLAHIIYYAETIEPVDIIDGVLMSNAYKAAGELDFKIILTGDGSDEYLAGYDLFKQSPAPEKLMEYRLGNLYRTDLQRLDRCTMRYRLEARSPFMDKALVQFGFNVPMRMKIKGDIEKWILREACRDVLPDYLRMRRKVRTPHGTGLFYRLKEYTASLNVEVAPKIMKRLHIENTESDTKYTVSKYLEFGYPLPKKRFKQPGLDFHKDGFFIFEHLSETHSDPSNLPEVPVVSGFNGFTCDGPHAHFH